MPIDETHSMEFPSFQLFIYAYSGKRRGNRFDDEMPITIQLIQNGTFFSFLSNQHKRLHPRNDFIRSARIK